MKPGSTLVLKCATSGFRVESGRILEVAAVWVDQTNQVTDYYCSIAAAPADTKIPAFHQALLAECSAPGAPELRAVEGALIARGHDIVAVCSRALDFQLEWVREHMPAFARTLRTKVPIELKGLELLSGKEWPVNTRRTYRAGDDVADAVQELLSYRVEVV